MGFKFTVTSPGYSAENYSAAATNGYIDGPLRMRRTVVCICRPGMFFCYVEIRAHTTEPTMGRQNCDGPSSGNRRVINELYPIRPGWTLFQKSDRLNPQPLIFTPLIPYSSHLPYLFNFYISPSLIITPTILQSLKTIIY